MLYTNCPAVGLEVFVQRNDAQPFLTGDDGGSNARAFTLSDWRRIAGGRGYMPPEWAVVDPL